MQHGSRNGSGRPVTSSLGLMCVTAVAVLIMTAWLVSSNLNPNLCYLTQQETLLLPASIETDSKEGLQLVIHVFPEQGESVHRISSRENLEGMKVYDSESACTDNVDMRLETALVKERLHLILSTTSRVYIVELSYHHICTSKTSKKILTSTISEKNVADVKTLQAAAATKNSYNIITSSSSHPCSIRHVLVQKQMRSLLSLNHFSNSLIEHSLEPLTANIIEPANHKLDFCSQHVLIQNPFLEVESEVNNRVFIPSR